MDQALKLETTSVMSGLSRQNSGFQLAESMSTEWTNEKHSSYLNSMEASFVKQLYNDEYNRIDLLGWRPRRKSVQDTSSSQPSNANTSSNSITRTSSGQFKVLQNGCWKKIDFERAPHLVDTVDNAHLLEENPWIQHFKFLEKHQEQTSPSLGENGAHYIKAIPLGCQPTSSNTFSSVKTAACHDSVLIYEEVSDQNFVDEESESEQLSSKRLKTLTANLSTKDQVVPSRKSPFVDNNRN